jgi:hypothetical protein
MTGADGPVAVNFVWQGSSFVNIVPSSEMNPGAWYSVKIVLDSVKDYTGWSIRDSVKTVRFRVIEDKLLGSMKGKILGERGERTGKIHIMTHEITTKSIPQQEVIADSTGDFEIPHLQEGKYVLSAFGDGDGDGKYSFGRVVPFLPSERFVLQSDTLKVRARWPLEGIVLRF